MENNILEISIEKAVYGGYGLGFYDGKAIFIANAIPEDIVRAEIIKSKKDYSFAEISEFIQKSDSRIEPECKNFNICGGCSYLCVNYDTELDYKKKILIDQIIRISNLNEKEIPILNVVSNKRFNYRSHATIKSLNEKPGFYKKGTNNFIPINNDSCLLLDNTINSNLQNIHFNSTENKIAVSSDNKIYTESDTNKIIKDIENKIIYNRNISQFFQANKFLRATMLEIVKDYASLTKSDNFIDMCCGVGFFALYLSKFAQLGFGFDIDKKNIKWAKQNAIINNIDNVNFYPIPSSDIHPVRYNANVIIIDPPRAGIDKKTRKTITAMNPERLVYISCNPSTFSRDTKDFIKAGYKLSKLTFIDMFPCTFHIEVISCFEK